MVSDIRLNVALTHMLLALSFSPTLQKDFDDFVITFLGGHHQWSSSGVILEMRW